MARGKVGDVVFSRADGEQISRVRNRHPKNPKSNGQQYQRAIMATVMRAYSAGKEIFDHSFQGYAKGAECQRYFMKLNADALRAQIAQELKITDYNTLRTTSVARVVAPSVNMAVANTYKVSEGDYPLNFFCVDQNWGANEGETVAAYSARMGLVPGDIYTLVCFEVDVTARSLYETPGAEGDPWGEILPCKFFFYRFQVKADVLTNTETVMTESNSLSVFSNCLELTAQTPGTFVPDFRGITTTKKLVPKIEEFSYYNIDVGDKPVAMFTVIRSRLDSDLRSTNQMEIHYPYGNPDSTDYLASYGICPSYILDAWKADTISLGNSDLILEGGDI